jgi:N-acyl-D-amino-acid deacylase
MFDLLLRGGLVVDGTGAPRFRADIAIEGDAIAAIGPLEGAEAAEVIDVSGLIVAPGFVDTHAHSDGALLNDRQHENGLRQGITTEVIAQDGMSFAPLSRENYEAHRRYLGGILQSPPDDLDTRSIGSFLDAFEGVGPNVVMLVPHGPIRVETVGFHDVPLRGEPLEAARRLVAEGMDQGARGLATGLSYYPQSYSDTDELAALCEVVAERGGVYVTHVRNHNTDRAFGGGGIPEALEIGRRTGVKVHISHYRTSVPNAGQVDALMAEIDAAKLAGVDVTIECYPYVVGSTVPGYFLPGEFHEGGADGLLARLEDADAYRSALRAIEAWPTLDTGCWTYLASAANRDLIGVAFADAAERRGVSVGQMMLDVMLEERLQCGFRYAPSPSVGRIRQVEADVMHLLDRDDYMIGSDAIPLPGLPHPRAYGCFPRVVGRLRRRHNRPLEQVVQRVTQNPARRFSLDRRGELHEGWFADLVVFDDERISDLATFEDPTAVPAGIPYVIVNGRVAVTPRGCTGVLAGRPLR